MAISTRNITIQDQFLVNKIHVIRGTKVMLDSDLAELYGVESKRINEQVKRNAKRFPEDFMFKLSKDEWKTLRSQFATSKTGSGGRTYLPHVFTEHGVLMLSSVLNSQRAIQMNIQIVRVFTHLRSLVIEHSELKNEINEIKSRQNSQDKNIELVFTYLDELTEKKAKPRKRIGFMPDDL